jgi:hypothetical protein
MRHSMAAEWRFRYEVFVQTSPVEPPVPVNLSTRSYECKWLAEEGSDTVVATATIDASQAVSGAITAVVQESAVASAGVGDHWYYLIETISGEASVRAVGVVTVEDDT